MKFESKFKAFHSWKCIWKSHLPSGGNFIRGDMSDLEIEIRENGDKHTQPAHVLAGTRRTVTSEDRNSVISRIAYRADSRLRPANDRRHYFVTTSLICWAQAQNQPWCYYVRCDHNNVIKWKHFPRYCPFVRGIHRSPVNFPHKGQWRGALMVPLIPEQTVG